MAKIRSIKRKTLQLKFKFNTLHSLEASCRKIEEGDQTRQVVVVYNAHLIARYILNGLCSDTVSVKIFTNNCK